MGKRLSLLHHYGDGEGRAGVLRAPHIGDTANTPCVGTSGGRITLGPFRSMLALPAIGKTAKGENRLLSVSEPRTLYKYMIPQRALNCIPEVGDGTLRATQPAALNDPFECAVATAYVFEDEAEEDRELAKVLTEINENKPISAIEVLTARIEYGSLFTRQLLSDQISTRFGIVSFTANPHYPLMWSLYTTDGSGFVIGYDMSQLRKLSGPVGELRAVQYNDQPPMFIGPVAFSQPQSNIPALLSLKSNHWSHEEEWRLIVELNKTVGTGQTDQHGLPINLVQIPNEAVVAVFYTERTSGQDVQRIRARLADPNNRYQA